MKAIGTNTTIVDRFQAAYDAVWHPDIPKNDDYYEVAHLILDKQLKDAGLINQQAFQELLQSPQVKVPQHQDMLLRMITHMRKHHPEIVSSKEIIEMFPSQKDPKNFVHFARDLAIEEKTHPSMLYARLPSDPSADWFRDERDRHNKELMLLIDTNEGPKVFCKIDKGGTADRFENATPAEIVKGFIAHRQRKGHSNEGEYMPAISHAVKLTHDALEINKENPERFKGAQEAWDNLVSVIASQPSAIKSRLKNSAQRLIAGTQATNQR